MLEKLRAADEKYISIEQTLADPSVFSDKEKLSLLNKITHKYIKKLTEDKIDEAEGLIILDAPLLFEAGEEVLIPKTFGFTTPFEMMQQSK